MNHSPVSYNVGSINTNAVSSTNKVSSLRSFVRLMDFDIVLLQEVECANLCIPGYNVITNVDNAKRGTAIALKAHIPYSNVQRSLNSRILTVKVDSVTICNIYAYSGNQNFSAREDFSKNNCPIIFKTPLNTLY